MNNSLKAGKLINILSNQIKRQFGKRFWQCGITGVQGGVLHYILIESVNRDIFQKDIEEAFQIRRSTATNILQLMEKNNFIKRENVPYDKRLKKIVLTEKAMELQELVIQDTKDLDEQLEKGITKEEMDQFLKVIQKMLKNMEQEKQKA